jgi:Reverse transcriptase (RNA-dependent DNA polymerase)/GAG-pre-integrase domain
MIMLLCVLWVLCVLAKWMCGICRVLVHSIKSLQLAESERTVITRIIYENLWKIFSHNLVMVLNGNERGLHSHGVPRFTSISHLFTMKNNLFTMKDNHMEIRRSTHFAMSSQTGQKCKLFDPFDTDSFEVKIDNCCSKTLSGHKSDFVKGTLHPVNNMAVEGYSGSLDAITHKGTVRWTVSDDNGKVVDILIPGSLYVPGNPLRLLSPQHLAQGLKKNEDHDKATRCTTFADKMVLEWDNLRHKKTVQIDSTSSNIGRMFTVAGFQKYQAFATKTKEDYRPETNICYRMEIQDKDQALFDEGDIIYEKCDEKIPDHRKENDGIIKANLEFTEAFLNGEAELDGPESFEASGSNAEDELLRWHYRMSHISMSRLQKLASQGYLPKRLATCRKPLCQACVYGKLTKRPWRTKGSPDMDNVNVATVPGQCVSVDQLESPIEGFVGQMKGKLTTKRYKVATIFVDHYSNLSFVHLQSTTNAEDTLKAKQEFEAYAASFHVNIIRYHADNGRFAENVWKQDILNKNQQLTFSGVGAHHQNGRAEKRIRDLQDLARTSLIHAHRRWPLAVDVRLWPYALRHANHSINHTPFPKQDQTPIELFSKTTMDPNLKQHHPFGCPAYVLDGHVQSGKKAPKWNNRARLAIYLGPSLQHAKSVSLVLSLTTGLVSPQFHIKFDDAFDTLRGGVDKVVSQWQHLAGFEIVQNRRTRESPNIPISMILPTNAPGGVHSPNTLVSEGAANMHDVDTDDQGSINEADEESVAEADEVQTTTRSGRIIRPPTRYDDYVAYSCDIIQAYSASTDPDVMYMHQAMAAPDRDEFLKAMKKEVDSHTINQNWIIINKDEVPNGHKILPAVWAMRRKRDIETREVYKWKARLNIHGGKQEHGINYWDTYAPVASWASIRLVLIMAVLRKWKTKQLDFVLAFPQAPVETDLQ